MSKVIAASTICVLLLGSSALAGGLMQLQDFSALAQNYIDLMNGEQHANSTNWATISNDQCATGTCGLFGKQSQNGFISQVGNSCGQCTWVDLDQVVIGNGTQTQDIGDGVLPKTENQTLFLDGYQTLMKTDGGGSTSANQTMTITEDQNAGNATGPMGQSTAVFGTQDTSITGGPGATAAAGSALTVTTCQTQMVY
jgi:hypothetical protein